MLNIIFTYVFELFLKQKCKFIRRLGKFFFEYIHFMKVLNMFFYKKHKKTEYFLFLCVLNIDFTMVFDFFFQQILISSHVWACFFYEIFILPWL